MPDGDCLEIKKGQENAIAGRADVVWEKSGVLQARLQVQRCLDRLCQGWVLQNIYFVFEDQFLTMNFLSIFILKVCMELNWIRSKAGLIFRGVVVTT